MSNPTRSRKTKGVQSHPLHAVVSLLASWKEWREHLKVLDGQKHVLPPAMVRGAIHTLTGCIGELEEAIKTEKQANH